PGDAVPLPPAHQLVGEASYIPTKRLSAPEGKRIAEVCCELMGRVEARRSPIPLRVLRNHDRCSRTNSRIGEERGGVDVQTLAEGIGAAKLQTLADAFGHIHLESVVA